MHSITYLILIFIGLPLVSHAQTRPHNLYARVLKRANFTSHQPDIYTGGSFEKGHIVEVIIQGPSITGVRPECLVTTLNYSVVANKTIEIDKTLTKSDFENQDKDLCQMIELNASITDAYGFFEDETRSYLIDKWPLQLEFKLLLHKAEMITMPFDMAYAQAVSSLFPHLKSKSFNKYYWPTGISKHYERPQLDGYGHYMVATKAMIIESLNENRPFYFQRLRKITAQELEWTKKNAPNSRYHIAAIPNGGNPSVRYALEPTSLIIGVNRNKQPKDYLSQARKLNVNLSIDQFTQQIEDLFKGAIVQTEDLDKVWPAIEEIEAVARPILEKEKTRIRALAEAYYTHDPEGKKTVKKFTDRIYARYMKSRK